MRPCTWQCAGREVPLAEVLPAGLNFASVIWVGDTGKEVMLASFWHAAAGSIFSVVPTVAPRPMVDAPMNTGPSSRLRGRRYRFIVISPDRRCAPRLECFKDKLAQPLSARYRARGAVYLRLRNFIAGLVPATAVLYRIGRCRRPPFLFPPVSRSSLRVTSRSLHAVVAAS